MRQKLNHQKGETLTKVITKKSVIQSKGDMQLVNITNLIKGIVAESGVKDGLVNIFSRHTTTGIIINEAEVRLEKDILNMLKSIISEHNNYFHHRLSHEDGRMAVNSWSHLRSLLLGLNVVIPIENGEMCLGPRENIFFVELDGPQERHLIIQVMGTTRRLNW